LILVRVANANICTLCGKQLAKRHAQVSRTTGHKDCFAFKVGQHARAI
jgi:hypothetical protein